ncbi:hypothetical protein B0T10DRAFT_233250 [Thelonectria olida]|uniref:Uncharacterized protein n=1 Tax=Thelonectria olida TaxID=1576542 RepID=A0A9P8VSC7_9HYPO|nr:hypothetical protein B0T10DRAFT_233250 [Thelonectria olida]
MCFANLVMLICQVCGRRMGEQPMGTTPCWAMCGKFVSKVSGEAVQSECGVCRYAREERADLARRITWASRKYREKERGRGPAGDYDAFLGTKGKEDRRDEDRW